MNLGQYAPELILDISTELVVRLDTCSRRMLATTCRGNIIAVPAALRGAPPRKDIFGAIKPRKIAHSGSVPVKMLYLTHYSVCPYFEEEHSYLETHVLAALKARNPGILGVAPKHMLRCESAIIMATKHNYVKYIERMRTYCAITCIRRGHATHPEFSATFTATGVLDMLREKSLAAIVFEEYVDELTRVNITHRVMEMAQISKIPDDVLAGVLSRISPRHLSDYLQYNIGYLTRLNAPVLAVFARAAQDSRYYSIPKEIGGSAIAALCLAGFQFQSGEVELILTRAHTNCPQYGLVVLHCYDQFPVETIHFLVTRGYCGAVKIIWNERPGAREIIWDHSTDHPARLFEIAVLGLPGTTQPYSGMPLGIAANIIADTIDLADQKVNSQILQGIAYAVENYKSIRAKYSLAVLARQITTFIRANSVVKWAGTTLLQEILEIALATNNPDLVRSVRGSLTRKQFAGLLKNNRRAEWYYKCLKD